MITVLRWVFAILWLVLLVAGVGLFKQRLDRLELPQPELVAERKSQQEQRLELMNELDAAIGKDALLLRGFLLTGDEQTRDERQALWEKSIGPLREAMIELRLDLENEERLEQVRDLDELVAGVTELERAEAELVSVAFTARNQPALDIFQQELTKRDNAMRERLTTVLELERNAPAAPGRPELREFLARLRDQLTASMNDLDLYLRTGLDDYHQRFQGHYTQLQQTMPGLQQQLQLFSEEQTKAFNGFVPLFNEWQQQLPEVTTIRQRPDWNIALHILGQRVNPTLAVVLATNERLRQTQRRSISRARPKAGVEELRGQLDELRKTELLLVLCGAAGIIAVLLTLIPGRRQRQ